MDRDTTINNLAKVAARRINSNIWNNSYSRETEAVIAEIIADVFDKRQNTEKKERAGD